MRDIIKHMTDIFSVAAKKIGKLPPALRDDIGFELLDRVAAWHDLRKKLAEGIADIESGRVVKLPSAASLMRELKRRHGKKGR